MGFGIHAEIIQVGLRTVRMPPLDTEETFDEGAPVIVCVRAVRFAECA